MSRKYNVNQKRMLVSMEFELQVSPGHLRNWIWIRTLSC